MRRGACFCALTMTLSATDFYASLPKKRMGAGCLFFDGQGRVLLVKPAYKPSWEIPGGVVELDESPLACCRREVAEELGLEKAPGRLLVVDYNPAQGEKSESLMFIFDGGVLAPTEVSQIRLRPGELLDFGFFARTDLPESLTPALRRRILAAWQQVERGGGAYLENQAV